MLIRDEQIKEAKQKLLSIGWSVDTGSDGRSYINHSVGTITLEHGTTFISWRSSGFPYAQGSDYINAMFIAALDLHKAPRFTLYRSKIFDTRDYSRFSIFDVDSSLVIPFCRFGNVQWIAFIQKYTKEQASINSALVANRTPEGILVTCEHRQRYYDWRH